MSLIYGKRRLSKDVSSQEMRELRAQGLTNKKIAERLGVSVATIYRYIGKASYDPTYAEAKKSDIQKTEKVHIEYQKHPDPVEIPEVTEEPKKVVADTKKDNHNILKVLNMECTTEYGGTFCKFRYNTKTEEVEMLDGVVEGILDKKGLRQFIAELTELDSRTAG